MGHPDSREFSLFLGSSQQLGESKNRERERERERERGRDRLWVAFLGSAVLFRGVHEDSRSQGVGSCFRGRIVWEP